MDDMYDLFYLKIIVDTVDDDTVDSIEEITMGTQVEGSMVDWVFDVVHALDDSLFVNMLQSSEDVFQACH